MENTMKMYVTADEAAQILGVSRGYAYKIIRGLNNELKEKGEIEKAIIPLEKLLSEYPEIQVTENHL